MFLISKRGKQIKRFNTKLARSHTPEVSLYDYSKQLWNHLDIDYDYDLIEDMIETISIDVPCIEKSKLVEFGITDDPEGVVGLLKEGVDYTIVSGVCYITPVAFKRCMMKVDKYADYFLNWEIAIHSYIQYMEDRTKQKPAWK